MKRSVLLSSFLVAAVLSPMLLQTNYCSLDDYPKLARLELHVPDINGPDVIANFDPEYLLHKVELPADSPDTAVLLVQAQNATATIEVTYESLPISLGPNGVAPLTLAPDHSEIRVTVTAEDGKAWTYTVSIDRVDYCPCDDGNECTQDFCNPANQVCLYPAVPDGSACGGEYYGHPRGGCYGGLCNFVPVSVTFGAREVVFDWSADQCEEFDIPDGPARAVRASDGEIVLFGTIHETGNYLSRGNDFDSLEHDCAHPAHRSADLPTPESYENNEWLWSPYRLGESWHVLIHNEFHDKVTPQCLTTNCGYNSITYAVSTDNAYTFVKPSSPAHTVAPAPRVWIPPGPGTPQQHAGYVEGYFVPSNIVRGPDEYYYALFWAYPHYDDVTALLARACVMRTKTLGDPASWRAWDGHGFNLPMPSPYVSGGEVETCGVLETPFGATGNMPSLTYNTYLQRYMWVALYGSWDDDEEFVCGVYFSTSLDLLHWSEMQLLAKAGFWCDPPTPSELEPVRIQYPSIIDHEDTTTNFERPGRTPYLYYTRHNEDYWLNRDLIRVPLTFTLGGALCEGVDCDDQNECTEDVCNGADGSCEHPPVDCVEDFNDCTVDTCTPGLGCNATIADATPCAGGTCQAGACDLTGSVLPCTEQGLRNAVAAGGGPYTFSCGGPTTVVTQAEIVIDNSVILDGEGKLTVDGNTGHRVFSVAAGVAATLMNVTVTGGADVLVGGGILNEGTLVLSASTITGNTSNRGGGVANQSTGTLTVTNCTVSENTAGAFAGGLRNLGLAEVIDTTVSNNTATINNGGVTNRPGATMTLIRTTVEGNIAGVTAGGIQNDGTLTVINATVSGNEAGETGGGITNNATLTLVSTTVSGNTAPVGGAIVSNSGSVSASNVIIEGQCQGPPLIDSLGGNIESPGNTCFTSHPADQVSLPAPLLLLGPLQDNGGATMTHALLPGSAAIDWIPGAMCIGADGQPLTTDQRGQPRPAGPGCDVGSFEVQP